MKKLNILATLLAFTCLTNYSFGQSFNTYYGTGTVNKGNCNSIFGNYAGNNLNNDSDENCFFGYQAGNNTTNGSDNIYIGFLSGYSCTSGSRNTYMGYYTGRHAPSNAEGNVFIGHKAGFYQAGSNKLVIANTESENLIYGEFDNDYVKINNHLEVERLTVQEINMSNLLDVSSIETDSLSTNDISTNSFELNTGTKINDNALARIVGEYNPGLELSSKTDAKPRLLLSTNNGTDKWEMNVAGSWENRGLSFLYNNSNHLTISKNGNVGIAETNPAYKLDVAGTVKADNFISSTASFPDYVFEKGYEVMPLAELESFVKEHKHLPNMPSEKEVVENGMDLGDVTIKSVENIETIYLHLIELKKEIEALKKENAALKKH